MSTSSAGVIHVNFDGVPEIYQPLQTTRGNQTFQDLSEHEFTGDEKQFLMQQLTGKGKTSSDPLRLVETGKDADNNGIVTLGAMVARHNLKLTTVSNWVKFYNKGSQLHDSGGRPPTLTKDAVEQFKKEIVELEVSKGDNTAKAIKQRIDAAYQQRLRDSGRVKIGNLVERTVSGQKVLVPLEDCKVKDSRTVSAIKAEASIKDRKAQDLNAARLASLNDIRVIYKIVCCFLAFAAFLTAAYKWNGDCTQVIVRGDNSSNLVCVVRDRGDRKKVESGQTNNELDILLKIFALACAAGEMGRLVVMIAIKEMPEDAFFKAIIPGLSHTMGVGEAQNGFLYFSKDRGGTPEMWSDIYLSFVIPTIKASADFHKTCYADGSRMESFFHQDGEAAVMNSAFTPEVMEAFHAANIHGQKGGPSHTSQTQELDCGHAFDSLKAGVKSVAKEGTDVANDILRRNLKETFRQFHAQHPGVNISALQQRKIEHGLEVVIWATQKHWNPVKMREAARLTGLHIDGAEVGKETVNYDRLMTRHKNTTTSAEDYALMKEKRWEVAEEFQRNGRVTNEFLDGLGIVTTLGAVDRDGLTLCRQDAQLFTHVKSVQRFADRKREKEQAAEDLATRKAAAAAEALRKSEAAASDVATLVQTYKANVAAGTAAAENASWKTTNLDVFKAFYRTITWSLPMHPKPQKQPTAKAGWVAAVAPYLPIAADKAAAGTPAAVVVGRGGGAVARAAGVVVATATAGRGAGAGPGGPAVPIPTYLCGLCDTRYSIPAGVSTESLHPFQIDCLRIRGVDCFSLVGDADGLGGALPERPPEQKKRKKAAEPDGGLDAAVDAGAPAETKKRKKKRKQAAELDGGLDAAVDAGAPAETNKREKKDKKANMVLSLNFCQCGDDCSESKHACPECSRKMHGFCGVGMGEEGFGQARLCQYCQ